MNAWKKGLKKRLLALFCVITLVLGMLPTQMLTVDAAGTFSVSLSPNSGVTVGTTVTASLSNGWDATGTDGTRAFTTETAYEWKLGETVVSTSAACTPEGVGTLSVTVTQTKTYTDGATPASDTQSASDYVTVEKGTPELTVTLDPANNTAYNSNQTLTASVTAACGGINSISGLTYTYTWYKNDSLLSETSDTLDVGTEGVGTYKVNVAFAGDDNFNSASKESSTVTISQATPTVTVSNPTVQYNDEVEFEVASNAAGSITISGTGAETETLTGSAGSYSATVNYGTQNVGTENVTWSFTSSDGNYTNTSGTATYTVTSGDAEASVSVDSTSPEYGDGIKLTETSGSATGVFSYTLDGNNSTKDAIETASKSWTAGASYTIGWTFAPSDSNYATKTDTISVTVEKKNVTVTFSAKKEYDGTYSLTSSDTISDISVTVNGGSVSDPIASVVPGGSTDLDIKDACSGESVSLSSPSDLFTLSDTTNYIISAATGTVTITKAELTITDVAFSSMTYTGATDKSVSEDNVTYTFSGYLDNTSGTVTGMLSGLTYTRESANVAVDGGSATYVKVNATGSSVSLDSSLAANYTLAAASLDTAINKVSASNGIIVNPLEVTVKAGGTQEITSTDSALTITSETSGTYTPTFSSTYFSLEQASDESSLPDSNVSFGLSGAVTWSVTAGSSGVLLGTVTLGGYQAGDFAITDTTMAQNYTITGVDFANYQLYIKGTGANNIDLESKDGSNTIKVNGMTVVTFDRSVQGTDAEGAYWYDPSDTLSYSGTGTLYVWASGSAASELSTDFGATGLNAQNGKDNIIRNVYVDVDGTFYGPFTIAYYYDGDAPSIDVSNVTVTGYENVSGDEAVYYDNLDQSSYLTYTITLSDENSGIDPANVQWATSTDSVTAITDISSWNTVTATESNGSYTFEINTSAYGALYVIAYDYAGNVSELANYKTLVVENAAPSLTVTVDGGLASNSEYAADHTFSVSVDDAGSGTIEKYSGVWKVEYTLTKEGESASSESGTFYVGDSETIPSDISELSSYATLEEEDAALESGYNGTYILNVTAYDFCGNSTSSAPITLYFDNIIPTANITMNGTENGDGEYYYSGDTFALTVSLNDNYKLGDYTVTLTDSEGTQIVASSDSAACTNFTAGMLGTTTTTSQIINISYADLQSAGFADGEVTISIDLEDSAQNSWISDDGSTGGLDSTAADGNQSTGVKFADHDTSATFILDTTAPELLYVTVLPADDSAETGSYYEDTDAYYFNSDFVITFAIEDAYFIDEDDGDTVEGMSDLSAVNSSLSLEYAVTASDNTDPNEVTFTITLTSGADIEATLEGLFLTVTDKAGNPLNDATTVNIIKDDVACGTVTVSNGTAKLQTKVIIDTVSPVLTLTYAEEDNATHYNNDAAYYNASFTAAYQVDDTFDLDLTQIYKGYSFTDVNSVTTNAVYEALSVNITGGKTYTADDKVTASGVNESRTGHDTDGTYVFGAYGVDRAGNGLVVKEQVNGTVGDVSTDSYSDSASVFTGSSNVLDTMQPLVTISYPWRGAAYYYDEGAYYNNADETLAASYTFTDENTLLTDSLTVGYEFTAIGGGSADVTTDNGSDGTSVAKTLTVNSGDGAYTFTVSGTDLAGNLLYVTEEYVDASQNSYSVSTTAAAETYTGKTKILDTVAPTLTIDYTNLDDSYYYTESVGNGTEVYAYYNVTIQADYSFYDASGLDQTKLFTGYSYDPDENVTNAAEVTADNLSAIGTMTTEGLGEGTEYSNAYIFTAENNGAADGLYNYLAYGEDKAGNALTIAVEYDYQSGSGQHMNDSDHNSDNVFVGQTKVMDTVSPVYTSAFTDVDADNTGAVDENYTAYYNTDISVTFTIEDTNLDNGLITTGTSYLTSSDYSTASPAWVSISGNAEKSENYATTYTTEAMTFSSGDGVYRYEVYARDKAGNLLVQSTSESAKTAQYQTVSGGDGSGSWWTLRKVYDTVAPTLEFNMLVNGTTVFASSYTDVTSGQASVEGALAVTVNKPYQSSSTASANISTLDLSPTTFEYVFKTTEASGGLSNSNTTTYYADSGSSTTGWEASNGEYNNSNDISFSGQQTVELTTLKVKDRAGNELVITVPSSLSGDSVMNKIYLDVTPPSGDSVGAAISLDYGTPISTVLGNGRGPSGNPLYSSVVTVTARVQDPYGDAGTQYASSGLYRVYFEVLVNGTAVDASLVNASGNGTTVTSGTTGYLEYNTSGSSADFGADQKNETLTYSDVITFTFDPSGGVFNNNDIEIRVWAEDNSGNGGSEYSSNSSRNSYSFGIDITSPQIRVTYDNNDAQNEKYFKADRTATVVVTERNFDPDTTIITTEDAAIISGWTYTAGSTDNGDDDTWTATVIYNVDGDYTFNVTTADRVGLKESAVDYADSVAPQEFTIDKTVPVITVVFDNNDVRNGRYYNDTRLATISIDEHNFSAEDVEVITTAEIAEGTVSVPATRGWNSVGDLNSATVNFSEDGDYTMTVTYTDLAGNEAQTVIIDLFTVDTTAPALEIRNVEDYMAYNGDVAPSITYYDINYDSSSANVSITGYNHPTGSNLTGTRSEDAFGGSFVCDNIEAVRENDDVYVLTAYVSDLAGNVTEETITFSVNRFGSNYILSVSTQEVVDGYYTAVSPVVEVTEINVNELTSYQVSTSMNGEVTTLTDETDYSVTSSNPGWWQYVYTIAAANYEAEGTYSTTLLSVDAATNSNSNRAIKQNGGTTNELTIEFTVDKTAPTVVISGVEQDEQYIDTNRTIMVYYDDNIAVTHVTFYVNDEVVAEYYNTEDNYVLSGSGELSYVATAQNRWQTFTVVATDEVGNVSEEVSVRFLLTDNLFVQWFNNTPLFAGSIVGILLLGGFIFFIILKRRKDEDEEQAQG